MRLTRQEAEQKVRNEGYDVVFTYRDTRNNYYAPHRHDGKTTHVLLSGSLEYCYPDEGKKRHQCSAGDVWDVEANKLHEVWIGSEGATYVIGE